MDGAASDLRTGLPWQMVEIHEPVRLLFVSRRRRRRCCGIMDSTRRSGRMVRNGWVQLAVLDPDSPAIQVFRDGGVPRRTSRRPTSCRGPPSSVDWYRGWRDHLEFAEIGSRAVSRTSRRHD